MQNKSIDFTQPLALYGGSFDPVHAAHLALAETVCATLSVPVQFAFVPNFQNPLKVACVADDRIRLELLRRAIEETDYILWSFEILQKRVCYTVDTLRAAHVMGAKREGLYFVMGADAYANFEQWREHQVIVQLARLIIVNRSTQLPQKRHQDDIIMQMPPMDITATDLRAQLSRGQIDDELFPPAVSDYLHELILKRQNPYGIQE